MARYQELDETRLDDAQRRVWNECKAGPRGAVPPPVHIWLNSPGLADHAHKLGAHVRFATGFTPRQTEIAILMTARYWTAQFEWAAHVRLALRAGLPQHVIEAIAERRTPEFGDPDDELVWEFCRDYYDDHRVDEATFQRVVGRFGEQGAVDLAGLIGYYSFVSVTLNVFEVPTPPDAKLLEK
jgi:4-carboxymuconolactone decarboxylase